jgi:ketosteroid isomerase-like protein
MRRPRAGPKTAILVAACVIGGVAGRTLVQLRAQTGPQSDGRALVQADGDFARSVAERDRQRFLSFIGDPTTFNGGTANELRGRDAVLKEWTRFFNPNGPTLSWTPTKGEVIGAGDVGYTTGRSIVRTRTTNGTITERRGEYLTVWRRQGDGSWKVVFDTGSTLPASQ